MSKSQLQANNSKLSALITELQGKAAGGSGGSGGGAVETCTVTVRLDTSLGPSMSSISRIIATTLNNGSVEVVNMEFDGDTSTTIENVVSGFLIYIYISNAAMYDYTNANLVHILSGGRLLQIIGTKDSPAIIGFA